LVFLPAAIAAYLASGWIVGTNVMTLLEASGLLVVVAISTVALVSISMMSFSSLQKERVGSNQPVGIGIGGLVILADYIIPFVWRLQNALLLELAIALAIGAVSIALFILSGRLISREKLLP
jgi:hypothetical protein